MKKTQIIRMLLDKYPNLPQDIIADMAHTPRPYVTKVKNKIVCEKKRYGLTDEDIDLLDKLKHPELYNKELNR